jgi:hypothetical protein
LQLFYFSVIRGGVPNGQPGSGYPRGVSISTAPLAKTYPPVAASVPRARWALAELAIASGAAGEQLDAVRLAVSEAMTSAVVRSEGQIRVTAAAAADGLDVSIADDGVLRQPDLIGQKGGSGPAWGLSLIAHSADQLAIAKRPAGGTELRMHFGLGRAQSSKVNASPVLVSSNTR